MSHNISIFMLDSVFGGDSVHFISHHVLTEKSLKAFFCSKTTGMTFKIDTKCWRFMGKPVAAAFIVHITEFACSLHVCSGSLQILRLPATVQRRVLSGVRLTAHRCEGFSVSTLSELASPGSASASKMT